MELCSKCLVRGFPQAMCGEVEWDSQVFVLLDGGAQPLLTMLRKVWVCQEGRGEWYVGLRRSEIAVMECFVDNVECSSAPWFFEVGGHAAYSVDFEVCAASAAELLGCFKRG